MALQHLLQIIFSFCCKPVKHKDALSTKMFLEFRKPGPCGRVARSRWKQEQTHGDTDTFSTKYNEDDADIMPQQQGKALMVFACYMSMLLIPQVQCPQLLLNMCVRMTICFSYKIQMSVCFIVLTRIERCGTCFSALTNICHKQFLLWTSFHLFLAIP